MNIALQQSAAYLDTQEEAAATALHQRLVKVKIEPGLEESCESACSAKKEESFKGSPEKDEEEYDEFL